jgi:hypothetical protein
VLGDLLLEPGEFCATRRIIEEFTLACGVEAADPLPGLERAELVARLLAEALAFRIPSGFFFRLGL